MLVHPYGLQQEPVEFFSVVISADSAKEAEPAPLGRERTLVWLLVSDTAIPDTARKSFPRDVEQ